MSKIYFRLFFFIATFLLLFPHSALAKAESSTTAQTDKHLALMYAVEGSDVEQRYDDFVTQKLKQIGFNLTDPHRGVNKVYKKLYGKTSLDLLSFLPVVNDEVVKPLFTIDPRLAGFNPFNMHIYKKIGEKAYHFGHLTPEAILDITGVDDPVVRQKYIDSFKQPDEMLSDDFGKEHAKYVDYKSLPEKRMMTYVLEFDRPEFIDDFVDEFQENFEDAFAGNGYVIAGFHNFMEEEDDEILSPKFDAFWTYALCHMKYSSSVFDNDGMVPEAGVFAPCTMYMFIPKGTNKLYIGMPLLENVKTALGVKDKMRTEFMDKLDKQIASILEEMGAKEMENINPLKALPAKKEKAEKKETLKLPVAALLKQIDIKNDNLATMYEFDGNIEDKYNAFVEKTINQIGFKLTDPHKRVNDHYKEKYGSTNLDILSFMSIANESVVKPLFNIDPRIAGFNPFNFLIYKKLDEDKTHIGHLTANAILDMLSITDEKVRERYTKSLAELDALIEKELGGKKSTLKAKSFAKERMMNFIVPFDKEEDIEDVVDNFQEAFEKAFEDNDYIIAGYNNFKETDGEDTIPEYEAFWTYSLCHFKFSYTVFDNEGGHPEGGLFAPCTMYMYIRKGDDKIVVGMPRLINWKATLGIDDKVRSDFIAKLDHDIPEIMKTKLGATEIENTNPLLAIVPKKAQAQTPPPVAKEKPVQKAAAPKVPKAPVVKVQKPKEAEAPAKKPVQAEPKEQNGYKIQLPTPPKPVKALNVITVGGSDIKYVPSKETNPHDHEIIFSERRPPDYESLMESSANESAAPKEALPGLPVTGRVSAYLRGAYMDAKEAKKALEKAGFKVLSVTPVNKKGTLVTIAFTDDNLLKLAKKKNSGFVGVMRLLVNQIDNQISITNPLYFARAFMGDGYEEEPVQKVLEKLNGTFKELKGSKDQLKYTLLPKYRFMDGMPYYKDMVVVAKGKDSKTLLAKLKKKKGGKFVDFVQQIDADTYLVGVELGKRTAKFIKKTGSNNASLLPYPILIEKGVAKIMEPKYYISINYPMLKMSNFMKIATIPDAIRNECAKLFK